MSRGEQMKISAIISSTGSHVASWRWPSVPRSGAQRLRSYLELAQIAEDGLLDAVFMADMHTLNWEAAESMSRTARYNVQFEPFTILSAMAAHTTHLGLVATASTTFYEPYAMARLLGSLDLLSGGRAGWNVVTSGNPKEGLNYGIHEYPPHPVRYGRAQEFVDVCRKLWDTFEDDAFVEDKASGQYYDPDKVHIARHKGEHFDVLGPLNLQRPPQGHPVLFQAGGSEYGRDLAARVADAVYSGEPTIAKAAALYADIKARMARHGRSPDQLKMMPGLFPVIGDTDEEARARSRRLVDLTHPKIIQGMVARALGGVDLSGMDMDQPVPDLEDQKNPSSQYHVIWKLIRDEKLTIRELFQRMSAGGAAHLEIVGSPRTVADFMEEAFESHAADGFSLMLPYTPEGLRDFTTKVVPELQRRGLFRTRYEGTTLRENLGLARPAHPAAAAAPIRQPA